MEILITNDDGINANGIGLLEEIMCRMGHVTVVAPDGPRSGNSNAISAITPLYLKKVDETDRMVRYTTNGTPTDCVKLALNELFADRKPDLLVSGINHGANSSICVIYSGTMGAVFEGCTNGILSIGFSICDHDPNIDLSHFAPYVEELTRKLMSIQTPYGTCYNINAPVGPIKGVRLARQCEGHWAKEFRYETTPEGEKRYCLIGDYVNHEPNAPETDEFALSHGYISIVPTTVDMTNYDMLRTLQHDF